MGLIRAVVFFHIRLERKGNCVFLKINNQFTNEAGALAEQAQLSVGGCLRAALRSLQGKEDPASCCCFPGLAVVGNQVSPPGSFTPPKCTAWLLYAAQKIWDPFKLLDPCIATEAVMLGSLSLLLLCTCACTAIFPNPIAPAVPH